MITAWRLVKSRHARAAFDGEGARLYGGRWNSPGTRVAYASDSVALAALEVLAHLQSTAVLQAYSLATIRFPESAGGDARSCLTSLGVAPISVSSREPGHR